MRFAGDTMANYGLKEAVIDTHSKKDVLVWELYRRKPVKGGLLGSAYYLQTNLAQVFEKRRYR